MGKEKSKWMKVSVVAAHFGVSEDTILRKSGMFSKLEIAKPGPRMALVLRASVEALDAKLVEMAKEAA